MTQPRPARPRETLADAVLCLGLAVAVALFYARMAPTVTADFVVFLDPWVDAIRGSEGIGAFATGFSNYTGGYMAVLWAVVRAAPGLTNFEIVKLTALLITLYCAVPVWLMGREAGHSRLRSLAFALGFMALPPVAQNGVGWGQADALYAGTALFGVWFLIRGRETGATLAFSLAPSLKLQAAFIWPLVLGRVLVRPRRALPYLLAFPALYLLSNAIWLAGGRPPGEVLTIYLDQIGHFEHYGVASLSLNSANLWNIVLVLHATVDAVDLSGHRDMLVAAGVAMALAAGCLLAVKMARVDRAGGLDASATVFFAMASVLVVVYLLPKMHDRYYFTAEALAYCLLMWRPRLLWLVAAMQGSAVSAYALYQDPFGIHAALGKVGTMLLADALATVAFVWVVAMAVRWPLGPARGDGGSA